MGFPTADDIGFAVRALFPHSHKCPCRIGHVEKIIHLLPCCQRRHFAFLPCVHEPTNEPIGFLPHTKGIGDASRHMSDAPFLCQGTAEVSGGSFRKGITVRAFWRQTSLFRRFHFLLHDASRKNEGVAPQFFCQSQCF